MNIKIITDENENHVFSSNQEKKLLFENSILFFDDQRPQSGARQPIGGAFIVDKVNDKSLSLTSKIDGDGKTVSGEGKAVTFTIKYSQVQALRPAILPHAVGDEVCQGWSANGSPALVGRCTRPHCRRDQLAGCLAPARGDSPRAESGGRRLPPRR